MASGDRDKCQYKKWKAPAKEPKPQKRPRKVIPLGIMQDHPNTVEQTYTNGNAE